MKAEAPNPNTIVWFNSKFVPLAEANVNILTHALNYGTGVFEGIRGYFEDKQKDLFLVRPMEHYERWKRNAAILRIGIPMGAVDLADLPRSCAGATISIACLRSAVGVQMLSADRRRAGSERRLCGGGVPFGDYFDSANGLKAGVVSWRRIEDTAIPGRAKICGAYVNSVLATDEAKRTVTMKRSS